MDSNINKYYVALLSIIVALGGFLLGFDSAVISGAVPYYSKVFGLSQSSFWFGFSVSSLTAGSILGNFIGGILADKVGRKIVLVCTALLFGFCALGTALATNFVLFIIARIIGGLGVGMAILVAPMYIAEVSPQKYRGLMVSINQLNIVLGISIAFFTNYIINKSIVDPNLNWRWMLGIGVIPAFLYLGLLLFVPQSPRWLVQKKRTNEAKIILKKIGGEVYSTLTLGEIEDHIEKDRARPKAYFRDLLSREMRLIMIIGLGIAALQQISAINAILYYATLIFQTTGGGRDSAFMQAAIIGIVNLVFTLVAMALIDRLGRKPLLIIGLTGIICAYLISSFAFFQANYSVSPDSVYKIEILLTQNGSSSSTINRVKDGLLKIEGKTFDSELAFFNEVKSNIGSSYDETRSVILQFSIHMNAMLVLIGILLFIASFAISLGPVTWALLSEIFPNRIRGLAISIAGTFNALVSTIVITVFPIGLANFGTGLSFMVIAILCGIGLVFVLKYVPETKGKSLEEIQDMLEHK